MRPIKMSPNSSNTDVVEAGEASIPAVASVRFPSQFLGRSGRFEFQRRGLGDIGAEWRVELGQVVGEERRVVAGAGDGDIAKSGG
jgi:hypothetical protein